MFCKSKKRDYKIPLDDNQKEYREYFGIVDKYLVQIDREEDGQKKSGYIVFIDEDNDIDWLDWRDDKYWTEDDKKKRDTYITKLNIAHCRPHVNLSDDEIFNYKKMLACGYVLALQKNFDNIDSVIKEAVSFLDKRNREMARLLFLKYSGIVAILVLAFWVCDSQFLFWNKEWVAGISMGVLGAYTSIFSRYGKVELTGLSSKCLHFVEALSRLFVGGLFAIVAIHAIKCGIILSNMDTSISRFVFAFVGFASGFSERFIPSLLEKFENNTVKNE